MKARKVLMFAALFALALTPMAWAQNCAQSGQCFTSYSVFESWLPIIILSILVSVSAVSAYYMFGVALNNERVKSRAIGELGQAVGTGIVVVAIIAVLAFVGGGIFSQVPAISPSMLLQICGTSQLGGSQTTFLQPAGSTSNPSGTFDRTSSGVPTPTALVCSEISNFQAPKTPSLTDNIDYGLFASYLILANMTNQSISNLNSLYLFEGWIGFATKFTAVTQLCFPEFTLSPLCGSPPPTQAIEVKFTYQPLAGYEILRNAITQAVEIQATITFYMFFLQLMVAILVMYLWPWLLAAGVILRASFFTRRAGGLLIAIVLAWLLIFPMLYATEYSAFQNAGSGGLQAIGASTQSPLPTLPLYTKDANNVLGVYGASGGGDVSASSVSTIIPGFSCPSNQQYVYEGVCGYPQTASCESQPAASCQTYPDGITPIPQGININFFVFPKVADVLRFYSCYPSDLNHAELAFVGYYLIPGFGAVTGAIGALSGLAAGLPYNPSDFSLPGQQWNFECNSGNAIDSSLALANAYGIMGVTAYLVPLINLIIIISTAVGISGLLGGDTDIIGLSKLL